MKYLYHGTTIEGMRNIICGRYDPDETVWNCSGFGYMYAYDLEKWAECEGYTSDEYGDVDLDSSQKACASRANESAQIANAISLDPYSQTCVIEFGISDELYEFAVNEEYIEPDTSVENMADYGAVQVEAGWLNKMIKLGRIDMRVFYYEFNRNLTPFYLSGLFENPYFEETLEKLPCEMYEAVKLLHDNNIFIEELLDPELQEIEDLYEFCPAY